MQEATTSPSQSSTSTWLLAVGVPILLIAIILIADIIESPKTAYVGVLTAVPLFAAIFGTPLMTAITGAITWLSGFAFGLIAADGNVPAQTMRLIIIAIAAVAAVIAATVRERREQLLLRALEEAAHAQTLRELATHDDLTGVLNRRGAVENIEARPPGKRTIALIDCDDFKDVNDRFGHPVGDEYLTALAQRLAHRVSKSDLVARWGGDEFLIVIDQPLPTGENVITRLLDSVSGSPITVGPHAIDVKLSRGVTELGEVAELDHALGRADRLMYAQKDAHRLAAGSEGSDGQG